MCTGVHFDCGVGDVSLCVCVDPRTNVYTHTEYVASPVCCTMLSVSMFVVGILSVCVCVSDLFCACVCFCAQAIFCVSVCACVCACACV